ncbi:hypothetical protein Cs7R123_41970 [Catellatospora sp. TT07R-123]|uniref:fibronectin type III domain-containing protein n=1 Tax=Catellatospora sp. TT07R-123 TaxID=2733863 RepID=UPI001B294226|nr:fibronectin type III domain-containing protein [Catellatospora sp. TT07R-123]GHJ46855.1 hypothetical protein Cs7R123_41970 [Catellatospora sp. TT07R-123]
MRTRIRFTAALLGAALTGATAMTAWQAGPAAAVPAPSAPASAPQAAAAGLARALGVSTDEARRQLVAQDRAHRLAATLPADLTAQLAGSWFDPDAGGLAVAVTSPAAAARARAAGAVPHLVARGPADLARILARVRAVVGTGVAGVYGWGADVRANDVTVNVDTTRQTAATAAALAALRAVDGVRLVFTTSAPRQQAGDVRTGSPWWPGSESNCSVGFPATDSSGGKHFLTAGHCTNDVNQPAYGASGQQNRLGTSNVGGSRSVNGREGDMGVVAVTETGWNLSASVNTWDQPAITLTGSAEAMVGDRVCHSGNTSKWQCGVVKYTHKAVDYGGGLVIEDLTWTTACSLGGDSGGGWLLGDKAVGLHDGGPSQCVSNPSDGELSMFQPVNEALAKWNLTLVTGGGGGDTAAPTAPGNARSTATTANSVSLAWDASTDNVGVTAYDVYQGATLATTVTGLSATVSGLSADTAYSFTVKARDAAGNTSPASNTVSARTQPGGGGDTQAPTAPGNPRSTAKTSNSVTLAWDASTDNVGVTGYEVYNGTALATTVTGLTATITGLAADTAYSFTVRARDAAGNRSPASAAVSVRTDPGTGRTFTNGTDYAILDNQQFYSPVQSTVTGSSPSTVTVSVTVDHTCAEDIGISLYAPNGFSYPVKYSGSGQYTCTPWHGTKTFTVANVLSTATGTWRLRVTDYGPGDTGTLDSWSLTL